MKLKLLSALPMFLSAMVLAQSTGAREDARTTAESQPDDHKCALATAKNGQKLTVWGKVRSEPHDMAFDIPGCDQTVLLTYAGAQDNGVSATELHQDAELKRFQEYTTSVYKTTAKNPCMECPRFGDVEASLTGTLEIATMPDGATRDRANFIRDQTGKIIGQYGWGHPGPFAAYRLVIQSVANVKARKLPPPS
jgi:hypothetical protein